MRKTPGKVQLAVMEHMAPGGNSRGSGEDGWHQWIGWLWDNRTNTERIVKSLIPNGWAKVNGEYRKGSPIYILTEAGEKVVKEADNSK